MKSIFPAASLVATATAMAMFLPLPMARADTLVPDLGTYQFSWQSNGVTDSTGAQTLQVDDTSTLAESYLDQNFQLVGSLSASNFSSPRTDLVLELDSLSAVGLFTRVVSASAIVNYQAIIELTEPLPEGVVITSVPVVIHCRGEADILSYTGFGQLEAKAVFTSSSLGINLSAFAHVSTFSPGDQPVYTSGFDEYLDAEVQPDSIVNFSVQSNCNGFIQNTVIGSFGAQSTADPVITINPTFQYANLFSVITSSNVKNVESVPEPSAWLMLAGGLGCLLAFRRRR